MAASSAPPPLVVVPCRNGARDVALLRVLVAATEQHHDCFAIVSDVDAVPGPPWSMRNSQTPSRQGAWSPALPSSSLSTRRRIAILPRVSRSESTHAWNRSLPDASM
jgi:hypothetical protein